MTRFLVLALILAAGCAYSFTTGDFMAAWLVVCGVGSLIIGFGKEGQR